MKSKFIIFFAIAVLFFAVSCLAQEEQEEIRVDYKGGVVVDKDLDGLTDEGEKQIFLTDPADPDSDGDGILDGAEVISKSNPLDVNSPVATRIIEKREFVPKKEIPWPWYATRASALIAFALLYLSILLGLLIRIPFLNRIFRLLDGTRIHCWISFQALIFVFLHMATLLFDKFLQFRVRDILMPFSFQFDPAVIDADLVTFGIFGMYLMVILVLTSYFQKLLPRRLWRALHFLNIGLYFAVLIHALYAGTDLKDPDFREKFILVNAALVALALINMFARIFISLKKKFAPAVDTGNFPAPEENQKQS